VLTVKMILIDRRPSALAAACAPVSAVPSRSFPTAVIHDAVVDHPVVWGPVTADAPQLPQVHQIQVQAELARSLVRTGESYGTSVSTVQGAEMAAKRLFNATRSGVPPRGRPV
jgi:hypothetical protein